MQWLSEQLHTNCFYILYVICYWNDYYGNSPFECSGKQVRGKMKKSVKVCLALFLAFAVLAQYSFSPQALFAYGLSNTDKAVQTEETSANDGQNADEQQATEATEPTDATEAAKPAGEDKEPAAGEEKNADKQDVKYPAVKFSEKAGDVTVNITAPEGALPEGTTVKVEPVKAGEVKDAVDDLIDNGKVVKAVDITFYDKNGKEIEPNEKVSVTFASDAFKKLNDAQVVHINNEGEAETVKGSNVEGNKATFKSDAFSIYVVVEDGDAARLLVKFTSGGTEVASMYVRKDDNMEQVVYDPGVGEIPDGVYFRGWTTNPNYTTDTDPMTIAEVRTDIASKLPPQKDGDTEIYYAMLFKSYTITYYDEYGISLGQQEVSFRADSADTAQSYTVNMAYTVQDTVHNFEGWKVKKGGSGIEGYKPSDNDGEGTFYENGTEITISGSVEFGVNAPLGHWLVFNENGKGATYNAPKFVHADAVTEKPCEDSAMSRYGYTFTGWYTDAACTTEFVFGKKLTDYTTVYAGWRANATANYTVIIWKQRSSDAVGIADANKKYDFAEAITGTGNVGAVITGVTQDGSNVNTGTTPDRTRNVRVNGTEKAYTGFHCDRYDTNVTINAEGTAVLNVYYDRNVITINFNAGGQGYNTILDENDNTYKNQVTYTGLYEAPLNFTWPTTYYDWRGDSHDTLWQYNNGTTLSFIGSFKLPNPSSVSINMRISGDGSYPRRFIQQNTDGSWPTEAHDTISMSGTNFTITDKYTGFTAYQYRRHTSSSTSTTGFEAWQNLGNPDSSGDYTTVNNAYQLEIRFARIKEPITYLDGVYVSGNDGEVVEESSHGELHQTEDIYYDADISAYGNKKSDKYYTPTAPAGYSDYVFDGWYADETCTVPYVWSTMPAEGVTVYAKWRQIQYRVFLHPNKPEGAAGDIDWGGDQEMNFRVSYGKTISEPTGILNGYEFVGWYKDEACTQVFNGDAYVLNETNVTDAYNSSQSDYQSSDTNRFWITKRFDIYAKWRATLEGASGIGVTYDLNGGSGSAGDTNTYVDGAWAPAAAAITAPEGKQFGYWVVQTWNEDEGKYVDDDNSVKVFPGNTFQVLKDNAKIEEITPTTEGGDTKKYTVQLKAVYIDSEEPTPTFITWFNNDGTAGYTNEGITTLGINESVPIVDAPTRDGYTFLGWAIFPEPLNYDSYSSRDEALAAAQEWEADSANWTQNLDADDIDISYNSGAYSANAVAANENTPYHAMFAVWEENDVAINYAVAEDSTGMGTVSPTSETIKAASGTAAGSTATAASSTYIIDYWTCDDGTEHVGEAAHFTPAKNSDGVYEAHTYYAHFKLNETTVTVHHYLKGTETKVKDDDVRTETIGSNFSATPATTYDEKTLSVDTDTSDVYQNVKVTAGGLEITIYYTLPLTVTVADKIVTYNGSTQYGYGATVNDSVAVDGLLAGDSITAFNYTRANGKDARENPYVGSFSQDPVVSHGSDAVSYYVITPTPGKLTITKAGEPEIKVTDKDGNVIATGAEKVYDGTPLSATASASLTIKEGDETKTLDVPVQYSTDGGETWTSDAPSLTNVRYSGGEVSALTVQVKTNDPNFEEKTTSYTLKVTQRPITVSATDTKTYNGADQTLTITKDDAAAATDTTGVVSGETLTLTDATITGKAVDEYTTLDGDYTWSVAKADESDSTKNYTIEVTGKLTITKAPAEELGLKAIDYEDVYDGKSHAASASVTVTEGTTIEYQVEGGEWTTTAPSIKDVGSQVVSVRATNANYETATATCTLKVKPKQVTVTADNKSKIYGDADPILTAKEEGTINGDSLATYYKLKREAGENVGTYVITFDISAEVSGSSFGDFLYVIGLADQKKTIGNYEVTFVDGTFEITPATLTITTPSARKVYDGTALTNANATITGLKNGDKATVTATGSRTNPGSSRNTYRINWGDTDPKNYTLKETFGTLTVTAAPTPGGGNPPGGGGNPGVGPAPAPAAPAQVVADNPTPTTVIDEPAPKAVDAYWALINLLCAIATALLSLIMLIRFFGKRRYEEEVMDPATGQTVTRDVDERRKGFARIASLIPAIGAIIAFIVTEDMSLPMAMVDKWTILMVVILAIQAGVGIFAKIRDNNEEEEDDEAMA